MVGSDIECFLWNNKEAAVVPCVDVLPGTKEAPHPIGPGKGYAVQEDNVMVEFNIPPATTGPMWADYIDNAKQYVEEILPKDHSLLFESSMLFKPAQLQSDQAKLAGCEPDFNAYTGGKMRAPWNAEANMWRGAGLHIHLGGDFQAPDFVCALIAELMITIPLGLRPDEDDLRAQFYGQPGIFRPKPYGIEYRSLGSVWAQDEYLLRDIGIQAHHVANYLTNTSALELQKAFRAFKQWHALREWFTRSETVEASVLQAAARNAGFPI
jgi:hypothetical protein